MGIIQSVINHKINLLIILALTLLSFWAGRLSAQKNQSLPDQITAKEIQTPLSLAQAEVNQEIDINFTINNEPVNLKYQIQQAELQNEIIVKGQKAIAASGKSFLILNLKITNDTNQGLQIHTRDFIRLARDENEWVAPDMHNDPVEVQALSTKYTKLGFTVNASEREFRLRAGEINGEKKTFEIKLI